MARPGRDSNVWNLESAQDDAGRVCTCVRAERSDILITLILRAFYLLWICLTWPRRGPFLSFSQSLPRRTWTPTRASEKLRVIICINNVRPSRRRAGPARGVSGRTPARGEAEIDPRRERRFDLARTECVSSSAPPLLRAATRNANRRPRTLWANVLLSRRALARALRRVRLLPTSPSRPALRLIIIVIIAVVTAGKLLC